MSEDSDALIREIDEEMRRERLARLWDQYGALVIGGAVAIVLLVGGWQWYVAYKLDRAQTAGAQFQEAVDMLGGKKKSEGLAAFEQIAREGTPAYAILAKLRLAADQREAGKNAEALALYQEIADDTSGDKLLRSFASLQIASLKVDDGTWTEVQNRLNDLADDSSPWRYTARELLGLAAFKHKQWSEARQAYTSLMSDPAAPQAIRQRAQTAMALITRESGAGKADLKKAKSAEDGGKSKADGAVAKDDAKKSQ